MDYIIEINNFSFKYDKNKIFDNISLKIKRGSFTTIVGDSRMGKTTLSKIFSGSLFSESNIKIEGKLLNKMTGREIRNKISVVSNNNDNIFVCNTVSEQIYFYLKNKNISKERIERKITDFICNLGYEYMLELSPNKLSDGEKQILALFLAVASSPKILMLDDGLSMVDNITKEKIFIILKKLNKMGLTIINFTNDSEDMLKGSNIIIFNNSKIILNSKVEKAFDDISIYEKNIIKLPFIIELSSKLKYYKVVDKLYFDSKKLVNDIWQ